MFSENEIVKHCMHCDGRCDQIVKCPLKIEWSTAGKRKILPVIPHWKFHYQGQHAFSGGRYPIEQLISGLGKLNKHLPEQ